MTIQIDRGQLPILDLERGRASTKRAEERRKYQVAARIALGVLAAVSGIGALIGGYQGDQKNTDFTREVLLSLAVTSGGASGVLLSLIFPVSDDRRKALVERSKASRGRLIINLLYSVIIGAAVWFGFYRFGDQVLSGGTLFGAWLTSLYSPVVVSMVRKEWRRDGLRAKNDISRPNAEKDTRDSSGSISSITSKT